MALHGRRHPSACDLLQIGDKEELNANPTRGRGGSRSSSTPVVMPQAVGLHGAVIAFDPAKENWSEYVERLEHYFTTNDIVSNEKRRAILLNAVGASTY